MRKPLAALLTAILAITVAPVAYASSPDGESSTPPSYEVDGGVSGAFTDTGPKTQTKSSKCTSNCVNGGIGQASAPDYQFSQTIWFDDTNDYYAQAPDGGTFRFNFDSLYILSKTSIPKADRAFGYNGNAIPAPGSGTFVIKDTLTVNGTKNTQTQPVFEQQWNPATGEVTQELVDTNEWEWLDYDYKISIRTMTAPDLQNRRCVTYGEYQLNGPFNKDHTPMTPVTDGGTMTRQPVAGGPISHIGQTASLPSALGKTMTAPKTGTPTLTAVWQHCLPNQATDFEQQRKDSISDLGRYEAPTTLWGSPVDWLHIAGSEADIARVFPALVTGAKAQNAYRYISGIAYVIRDIRPASRMTPFASYYKVVCSNGTEANKRSDFKVVKAKSYDGWDAQPWDDQGVDYYSWDCAAGTTLAPNEINTQSFLQCDTYGGQYGGVVENKPAAPLKEATVLVDGKPQALEFRDGAYRLPTTADPVHFSWERIRINTQDGTNILNSNKVKNTVWEFAYQLDPASSPRLKNTDVNAPNQPYHGWVDATPDDVAAAEMPLDRKWVPGQFYGYDVIPYSFTYKPYTYTPQTEYLPRQVTTQTRTYWGHNGWGYAWGCSCGGKCGNWSNGDPYCQYATYGWITETTTVVAPPPAGCYDNGSQYVCTKDVKDPAPAGYVDNGTRYQKVNPAPSGYTDNGAGGYTSNGVVNRTGQLGGIEFDTYREWPSKSDDPALQSCTVNPADYGVNGGKAVMIRCGDNVSDRARGAYFRYFQSSTAGSGGWRVIPWVKVTADVLTTHSQVTATRLNTDGTLSTVSEEVTNWVREPFDCPAQPVTVNVERVVS